MDTSSRRSRWTRVRNWQHLWVLSTSQTRQRSITSLQLEFEGRLGSVQTVTAMHGSSHICGTTFSIGRTKVSLQRSVKNSRNSLIEKIEAVGNRYLKDESR